MWCRAVIPGMVAAALVAGSVAALGTQALPRRVIVGTAPFTVNGHALYLLAASCKWSGVGAEDTGTQVTLYYPDSNAGLSKLRGLGFSGCGLERVYDDQSGHLLLLAAPAIYVIRKRRPAFVDRVAITAREVPDLILDPGLIDGEWGWTPATDKDGRDVLLFIVPTLGTLKARVWRFLAEPIAGQSRVQAGAWSDYANLRYGGSIRPGEFQDGEDLQKGGNGMQMQLVATAAPNGIIVPGLPRQGAEVVLRPQPPLPAHSRESVWILAATPRYVAVVGMPTRSAAGPSDVYILDRYSGHWRRVELPLGRQPTARVFGDWLALPPASAGDANALTLFNLANGRRLTIQTRQDDAECLAINGAGAVYRIADRLYLKPWRGNEFGPARLLADGPTVLRTHWAFWSVPPQE